MMKIMTVVKVSKTKKKKNHIISKNNKLNKNINLSLGKIFIYLIDENM